MKRRRYYNRWQKVTCLALLLFTLIGGSDAQVDSSRIHLAPKKKFNYILPASLLLTGGLLSSTSVERDIQSSVRDAVGSEFSTSIDDYTRYVPIGILLGADLAGVPAKNHWFDQGKNLAMSIIITDFITFRIKNWTDKTRPSGGEDMQSMPSAHTSAAFAHAAVLHHEFKDTNPWIAYSGYAFATTTGALRMANNKHWLSDVMVGAGIAITVTELIYYFDPIIRWNPFKKKGAQAMIVPTAMNSSYGMNLVMVF